MNLYKRIGSLAALAALIAVPLISLIWDKIPTNMSKIQYVLMICVVFLLLLVVSFLTIKISKINIDQYVLEMHEKIKSHLQWTKGVINISQRLTFIDDNILGVFEKDAAEIWVVTTTLEKDTGPLKDSVFNNLAEGKDYLYFTPPSDFPRVEYVEQNKLEYKRIYEERFGNLPDKEKKKIGQYRFLEFPKETLLFTPEIVIHNPMDMKKRRAFTYVETKSSKSCGEELVEISPNLTTHLVDLLRPIKDKEETIKRELFEFVWKFKLNNEDNLRLMRIGRREEFISDKDVEGIVNSIKGLSPHDKMVLALILERFTVFKD